MGHFLDSHHPDFWCTVFLKWSKNKILGKEMSQELLEKFKEFDTERLEQIVYRDKNEYTEKALDAAKQILCNRNDRLIDITHQYCPYCKQRVEMQASVCQCGYNFQGPNIEGLRTEIKKKKKHNRKMGIAFIFSGLIWACLWWPPGGRNQAWLDGFPYLVIVIGIIQLITGGKYETGISFIDGFLHGKKLEEPRKKRIKEDKKKYERGTHERENEVSRLLQEEERSKSKAREIGSKECPNCGLINPISAMKCDCGYKF